MPKITGTPLIVLGIALVVLLLGAWGLYSSDAAVKARERDARLENALESGPVEAGPTLEVEVVEAERVGAAEIVELSGVLEPIRATWVSAEIAGRIIEVLTDEHASIAAGDVLVRLDAAMPRAESIRAEAAHLLARSELARQERLGSRSVASEAELDRAKAEERRTYAALLEARTRLERTQITAPFDGLVNSLELDPGAYVQPGTPIAEILDVSTIELTVRVSDRQVSALRPEAIATVRIDPLGNEIRQGRIARVAGAAQGESQRFPIVLELDNEDGRLLPGMLAHVQFEIGSAPAIRLPARAVLHEFELDYVYVLDEQNAVQRMRVATRPVPFRPDQVEVESGLEEGARVVVTAVSQLRNGMRVLVR